MECIFIFKEVLRRAMGVYLSNPYLFWCPGKGLQLCPRGLFSGLKVIAGSRIPKERVVAAYWHRIKPVPRAGWTLVGLPIISNPVVTFIGRALCRTFREGGVCFRYCGISAMLFAIDFILFDFFLSMTICEPSSDLQPTGK